MAFIGELCEPADDPKDIHKDFKIRVEKNESSI